MGGKGSGPKAGQVTGRKARLDPNELQRRYAVRLRLKALEAQADTEAGLEPGEEAEQEKLQAEVREAQYAWLTDWELHKARVIVEGALRDLLWEKHLKRRDE